MSGLSRRDVIAGGVAPATMRTMATLANAASPSDLRLCYDAPAKAWTEALPLGYGRLAAMVFGGVRMEGASGRPFGISGAVRFASVARVRAKGGTASVEGDLTERVAPSRGASLKLGPDLR